MRGKGFTFNQFHIDHSRCAMKVGTDGTLLGAWSTIPNTGDILDIGTGTGLIAIMAAQRSQQANISAIDIDTDCVAQAIDNAKASKWSDRIAVIHSALQDFSPQKKYDLIISNPPYFIDSLNSPDTARTTARHNVSLTFEELCNGVMRLIKADGIFSLILPPTEMKSFLSVARGKLYKTRYCEVWSTPTSGVKRIMAELKLTPPTLPPQCEKIIIEDNGPMGYSEEYRHLTRDFYLKF